MVWTYFSYLEVPIKKGILSDTNSSSIGSELAGPRPQIQDGGQYSSRKNDVTARCISLGQRGDWGYLSGVPWRQGRSRVCVGFFSGIMTGSCDQRMWPWGWCGGRGLVRSGSRERACLKGIANYDARLILTSHFSLIGMHNHAVNLTVKPNRKWWRRQCLEQKHNICLCSHNIFFLYMINICLTCNDYNKCLINIPIIAQTMNIILHVSAFMKKI